MLPFMIALIQRVSTAKVEVDKKIIGEINQGILVLLGVEKNDTEKQAEQLLHKVINYRIFEDSDKKMNLSLLNSLLNNSAEANAAKKPGGLLIVPQFTLPANTNKGLRPSFTPAAPPAQGKRLYNYFIQLAENKLNVVETGKFGADMQVSLTNDGPITFWLQVE